MDTSKFTVLAEREKKTIYVEGDKRIKVFDSDFSKKDVLNEAYNQACVEETGLPIPKVLRFAKSMASGPLSPSTLRARPSRTS